MAKIVKRRIRWAASTSTDIVGYKIYWSLEAVGEPSYSDSNILVSAPKTNLVLPDETPSFPIETEANYLFGISAIDDVGNESDMAITNPVVIDFLAPNPPTDLVVETI